MATAFVFQLAKCELKRVISSSPPSSPWWTKLSSHSFTLFLLIFFKQMTSFYTQLPVSPFYPSQSPFIGPGGEDCDIQFNELNDGHKDPPIFSFPMDSSAMVQSLAMPSPDMTNFDWPISANMSSGLDYDGMRYDSSDVYSDFDRFYSPSLTLSPAFSTISSSPAISTSTFSRSPLLHTPGTSASGSTFIPRQHVVPTAGSLEIQQNVAALMLGPDEEGKFVCGYAQCGKRFGRKYNIQSHIQTHLSDRPFQCEFCQACFVRAHDLRRHVKIHDMIKPHTCACGKAFTRMDALTRHRMRAICSGALPGFVRKCGKRGRPRKRTRPDPQAPQTPPSETERPPGSIGLMDFHEFEELQCKFEQESSPLFYPIS